MYGIATATVARWTRLVDDLKRWVCVWIGSSNKQINETRNVSTRKRENKDGVRRTRKHEKSSPRRIKFYFNYFCATLLPRCNCKRSHTSVVICRLMSKSCQGSCAFFQTWSLVGGQNSSVLSIRVQQQNPNVAANSHRSETKRREWLSHITVNPPLSKRNAPSTQEDIVT